MSFNTMNINTMNLKTMNLKTGLSILVIAVAFIMSQTASASQGGEFVPVQCGEVSVPPGLQTEGAPGPFVVSVCAGRITGEESSAYLQAFAIQLSSGETVLYRVTEISNFLIKFLSGAVKSNVFLMGPQGEPASLQVLRFKDGRLKSVFGQVGPLSIYVPELMPVTGA